MNSVLLCEGSTDFALLQYFMRKVYGWEDKERGPGFLRPSRVLGKDGNKLVIGGTGGSSQILSKLEKIVDNNFHSAYDTEYYHKIAIVTDRDEEGTEKGLVQGIQTVFASYGVHMEDGLQANVWNAGKMENGSKEEKTLGILFLVIPFEETGALETFLLNVISNQDEYDKKIIEQGNRFVDQVDAEKRYLKSRRYITKAKCDVYFSIRTPAAFFVERQNILKDVAWDGYMEIQDSFRELEKL